MYFYIIFLHTLLILMRKDLKKDLVPLHYDLLINTDTEKHDFAGRVSVLCKVYEATNLVKLNSKEIQITEHSLFVLKDSRENKHSCEEVRKVSEYKFSEDENEQTIQFELKEDLHPGQILEIIIVFESKLSTNMNGYYVSKYKHENVVKYMFSTHFEATSARSAFPCFDQPDMKATYKVSLILPSDLQGISNSPESEVVSVESKVNEVRSRKDDDEYSFLRHVFDNAKYVFDSKCNKINCKDMKKSLDNENEDEAGIDNDMKKLNSRDGDKGACGHSSGGVKFSEKLVSYINSERIRAYQAKSDIKIMEKFDANKKFIEFDNTPIMSTYLVAFAIGDFGYIEKVSNYEPRIKLRVYAPRGEEKFGEFSLNVSHECIKIFQEYFQIDYPLKKLDMLAVPEFAMGAMENWGLITYRKSSLLFDPQNSTKQSMKWIAETVCHEIAHQWFGNLVTMQWWDDLWLNEGFATWASALGVSKLRKDLIDYDIWTSFISSDVEYGLSVDALQSSHPIKVEVNDPDEIDQIFDGISYSKGASLIRMLENYVTPQIFQKGLINYLNKHLYRNATTSDLWKELSDVSGRNVAEMMDLWVSKVGFPIVNVKEDGNFLILTQERFLMLGDRKNVKENGLKKGDASMNYANLSDIQFDNINDKNNEDNNVGIININNNIQAPLELKKFLDRESKKDKQNNIRVDQENSSIKNQQKDKQNNSLKDQENNIRVDQENSSIKNQQKDQENKFNKRSRK
ncbi:hypothetical protein EDEG_01714 [Edhazardia aedis USNM 41457]|uniref:Aminopeptidase n=1 Tax=Edhazardia aedis (strain USNM 41457) TaxID=1003232 RepID=J9D872_EDHAE|nr:hypothetical protein EDEG_01714 [Edhazardia aedis USNM 41457]|eukprot:EJW03981.1 hypothetical protein EDEG_01714 [Edhazardia aedis USNM 41457]